MHLRFSHEKPSFSEKRLCHDFVLTRGVEAVFRSPPTAASVALTAGEVAQLDLGVSKTLTAGARSYGIFMETKASTDTTTDPVVVQIIKRGQEYHAPVNTGTFVILTHVGELADVDYVGSEEGKIDLTPAQNDCIVVGGNVTANEVDVVFINTVY